MRTKKLAVSLAAIMAVAIGLSGCSPVEPGVVTAHADGATVTVALPASPIENEEAALALAASQGLPIIGDYLMLRPSEITIGGEIPETGVKLELTLPGTLPEDTNGRFAYFDTEANLWVPVATAVDGRTATAVVTHLSQWTFIVTGAVSTVTWATDAILNIGDGLAWWSSEGPGKLLYRHGGLLLGMQAVAPECDTGDLPGWVESATISTLVGLPEDNQNVLRCVGPDPDDPNLVQVKAAVNRGYAFDYEIADGVTPVNMQWSVLPGMSADDVDSVMEVIGETADSPLVLDPRERLMGNTELAFSVSQSDIKQLDEGTPAVRFVASHPGPAAVSYLYQYVLDYIDDKAGALLGAGAALHTCELIRPHELVAEREPAEWVGFFIDCLEKLDETLTGEAIDRMIQRAETANNPKLWQRITSKEGKQVLSSIRGALKWVDALTLGLTFIDYSGESQLGPSSVTITANSAPEWADLVGEWCWEVSGPFPPQAACQTIATTDIGVSHQHNRGEMEGCLLGGIYGDGPNGPGTGPGANLLYCSAETPTPQEFLRSCDAFDQPSTYGDDWARDRLWVYHACGAETWFRQ